MKSTGSVLLFWLGLIFIIEGGVALQLYCAHARAAAEFDADHIRMAALETGVGNLVGAVIGGVAGCLGSWSLALFLKIRKLERRILELEISKPRERASAYPA